LDVPAEVVARRSPTPLVVWAASLGKDARLAWHHLPRIVLADDPPVRIELKPPVHTRITMLGPDQKPGAAARVLPIPAGELPIPEPMGQVLAATSDARGLFVIPGLAPAALGGVRIVAPGFGTQTLEIPGSRIPAPSDGIIAVALAPVGRVMGRVVA